MKIYATDILIDAKEPVFLLTGANIISMDREIIDSIDRIVLEVPDEIISMLEVDDVIVYANKKFQIKKFLPSPKFKSFPGFL